MGQLLEEVSGLSGCCHAEAVTQNREPPTLMATKLTLTALLLGATAGIALADRATFDPTVTQMALPLSTPPTIDGVINTDEWQWGGGAAGNSWNVTPNENLEDGVQGGALGDNAGSVPASAADLSFYIYAGYDADNLYIAVHVNDDAIVTDSAEAESANGSTWMDDSVEVFIDGDNSNFETRDTSGSNPEVVGTGGQFVITANNAYRDAEAGSPGYGSGQAWYARTVVREDGSGYDAEFRISLKTLGNPKPGDVIGFTVGVNDDDDGDSAERQLMWVGKPHTEVSYGNLLLGPRSYEAPKTAAPTIDGKINAAEYAGAREIKIDPYNGIYDGTSGDNTWLPTDHAFSAWVTHDATAIYVAVDATDDMVVNDSAAPGSEDGNTWVDDSVEIFFDADLDRELGHSVTPFEGQYVFTANGAWRDNEANNPTFGQGNDWYAATTRTDHGYQIEFKVMKTALLDPKDGATLGFHICQNDDDGADRKAQLGWSGRAHNEFTYGTLKLAAGSSGGNPAVAIARSGKDIVLTFTGTLQATRTVNGTFADVPGATSPFKVTGSDAVQFYRARQ